MLVSDAVAAQGLADGNYRIGPQLVTVEGGRAYVTGTKVLCGSTTGLDQCVATLKQSLGKFKLAFIEPSLTLLLIPADCIPMLSSWYSLCVSSILGAMP